MRKPFIVLSAFLALLITSCAATIPARAAVDVAKTAAPSSETPTPAKPQLQATDLSAWVQDTTTDFGGDYEMAFRHATIGATVFVQVDSPGMLPEQKAAMILHAMEATGDVSASPLEIGTHDGILFAGFKTAATTERGLMGGAVIVRRVEGSSYLVTVVGTWPIESAPLLLADFQTLVSAVYVEGCAPPVPDLEDWFRPRHGDAPSLE
jgi:hypothetical protein